MLIIIQQHGLLALFTVGLCQLIRGRRLKMWLSSFYLVPWYCLMLHFKRHEPSVPVEQVTIKLVVLNRHLIFLQSGHLTLPVSSSPTTPLNDKNKLFNYLIIYAVSIFLYIFINGPLGYLNIINPLYSRHPSQPLSLVFRPDRTQKTGQHCQVLITSLGPRRPWPWDTVYFDDKCVTGIHIGAKKKRWSTLLPIVLSILGQIQWLASHLKACSTTCQFWQN